jgi:hypothetical protein
MTKSFLLQILEFLKDISDLIFESGANLENMKDEKF